MVILGNKKENPASYVTAFSSYIKVLFMMSAKIVNAMKAFTISESLIENIVLQLELKPLSYNSVKRRIDEMSNDSLNQLVGNGAFQRK